MFHKVKVKIHPTMAAVGDVAAENSSLVETETFKGNRLKFARMLKLQRPNILKISPSPGP